MDNCVYGVKIGIEIWPSFIFYQLWRIHTFWVRIDQFFAILHWLVLYFRPDSTFNNRNVRTAANISMWVFYGFQIIILWKLGILFAPNLCVKCSWLLHGFATMISIGIQMEFEHDLSDSSTTKQCISSIQHQIKHIFSSPLEILKQHNHGKGNVLNLYGLRYAGCEYIWKIIKQMKPNMQTYSMIYSLFYSVLAAVLCIWSLCYIPVRFSCSVLIILIKRLALIWKS